MSNTEQVPNLVQELYALTGKLHELFPGRLFTPDGHLVGSIGEVLAAHHYGLTLRPSSADGPDAVSRDGKDVEITTTQGDRIGLRRVPEHLLVLKLHRDGSIEEIYNGHGVWAWDHCGKMQRNGQRQIGLSKLKRIMEPMPMDQRLPQDHSLS